MSSFLIAGVDEVGRGPLAGPVIAAAVILNPECKIEGLADSKKLSAKKREYLSQKIQENALAFAIGRAEWHEIDEINILQASLLAMHRAVAALSIQPHHILVDGNQLPKWEYSAKAIIKGDQTEPAISAASIIAKVARDAEMEEMEDLYPGYGFAKHAGYPTAFHLAALQTQGVSPIHRRSFGPVRAIL
jgi:ribonuclease HII